MAKYTVSMAADRQQALDTITQIDHYLHVEGEEDSFHLTREELALSVLEPESFVAIVDDEAGPAGYLVITPGGVVQEDVEGEDDRFQGEGIWYIDLFELEVEANVHPSIFSHLAEVFVRWVKSEQDNHFRPLGMHTSSIKEQDLLKGLLQALKPLGVYPPHAPSKYMVDGLYFGQENTIYREVEPTPRPE